jgi:outer membrane protein, adhesin transport system
MKTRNILMFTASVTSLSSISTADSDNIAAVEQSVPAIAMATAASAVAPESVAPQPALAEVVTANIAMAVTPSIKAAVTAVESSSAAVAKAIVEPVIDATPAVVAAVPVDALISETTIDFVDMAPAVMPVDLAATLTAEPSDAVVVPPLAAEIPAAVQPAEASETIAEIVAPAPQAVVTPPAPTEIAAPATILEPVAKLSETAMAEAVPSAQSIVGTDAPATAKVTVPDAPQYAFFDDAAAAAAPAVAMQSAGVDYTGTVTLDQAIAAALETSPEINQAIMNKEAIEFEREQAQGLYLPRVDIEASAGIRRLENPTRRTLGIEDDELYPLEAGITAEQTVIDFGRRHGELMRQAARTDGAALRVAERSENTALLVSRQYLDILLQQRIVAAADDNVTFHRNLVGDLGQGVQQGSISIADQQQAQERLQAAIVRKTEAEESLVNAQIQLQTLTGLSIGGAAMPKSMRAAVSPTLGEAVAEARQNNPKVKEAQADVDAAHGMVEKANGDLYPTIGVDARGRVGEDIDGFNGKTNDMQARIVFKWNIFDGGINRAKYQEMVRRASETRFRLHELGRFAEEDVRRAWNSMSTQRKVSEELATQSRVSDDLLLSYREQFNVGRRSLLDVLDAQNTRYNVQVRLETAKFAEQFAEYQVLAATNKLLASMNLATPTGATSDARSRFDYGPPPPAELQRRRYPR